VRGAAPHPTGTAQAQAGADGLDIRIAGDWRARSARALETQLADATKDRLAPSIVRFALAEVTELDTVGAWLLVKRERAFEKAGSTVQYVGASAQHQRLIDTVRAMPAQGAAPKKDSLPFYVRPFDAIGRALVGAGGDMIGAQAVQGRILTAAGATAIFRSRFRFTAFVNQFDLIVFRAVPIVVLISIVVGAIITQQTILQLRNFGAAIFVADLAAILMLREVGLLLAAIMIAGRSGSAITAEIGSMRMREEIDALTVMGVDPYQALVLPRMMALVLGLPILAFIAGLAGIAGAAIVAQFYGDIPLATFIDRLQQALSFRSLSVGLIKAPFMAFIIGLIAVNEGLKVKGSAESLGRHTTASVVKSIFMVIVADGLFAVFFAAIGY
jgi:phospholipid/cholesterol/gamma-HCH transport system permease protein